MGLTVKMRFIVVSLICCSHKVVAHKLFILFMNLFRSVDEASPHLPVRVKLIGAKLNTN